MLLGDPDPQVPHRLKLLRAEHNVAAAPWKRRVFQDSFMAKEQHFDTLIDNQGFAFRRLWLGGIDNAPVKRRYGPRMARQEICLFYRDVADGDDYLNTLHAFICRAMDEKAAAPVVRFADGEYAFYGNSLECNGLYRQAESVEAIKRAMPGHIEALKTVARTGKLAPLVCLDNVQAKRKGFLSLFRRSKGGDGGEKFVEFLAANNIHLTGNNYVPFYVVYAYLTSKRFFEVVDKVKICIISSQCRMDKCRMWFSQRSSEPEITFTAIPDSYVATQWGAIKRDVLARVPSDTGLCLVGAGIGALLVCVDVALELGIPTIDAGHVLNMINDLGKESFEPRLYTLYK